MTIAINLNDEQVVISTPLNSSVKKAARKRILSSKRVAFAPYVAMYSARNEFIFEDRWYSPQEYNTFKRNLHRDILIFQAADAKIAKAVEQLMKACENAGTRYEELSFNDLSDLLPHKLESLVRKNMEISPNTVGLHKYSVQYLVQDRKTRRCEIVSAVLEGQSSSPTDSLFLPEGICQSISRPSRLFSQIIGHVAAKAA